MAKRRVAAAEPSLKIADFLALVHGGVATRLGSGLDGFDSRQRFGYVQYYRGDPGVHYEVWAQRKTGRVEVGLHFESADRDANYAALAKLADRIDDLFAAIGPEWELEEWTPQWTRVHRTLAGASLTSEVADAAAAQVVELIEGMEPLLAEIMPVARPPARARTPAKAR